MTTTINADLGEGIGLHAFGNDARLMELIDVANVACGFHAADPHIMNATVELAVANEVKIGAHPGTAGSRRLRSPSDDHERR